MRRVPEASCHPGRAVLDVVVGERDDPLAAEGQFGASLLVGLDLLPCRVCAVTGDLDDEPARELGVDASDDACTSPVRLLCVRAAHTRLPADAQEPPFEATLAAGVDQRIEQQSAAVDATPVICDHPSPEALLTHQAEAHG
jgi:hypothetical protein